MQLILTGKQLTLTPALTHYAQEKFQKLEKLSDAISRIHLTFNVEHHQHCIEARMIAHGVEHHATVIHQDMYAALDAIKKKLSAQLAKDKPKWHPHLSKAALRVPPLTEPEEG